MIQLFSIIIFAADKNPIVLSLLAKLCKHTHTKASSTFQIAKSRKYNHMKSLHIRQNDIKFSFSMIKVTKCRNLHVDAFNNTKYRFL